MSRHLTALSISFLWIFYTINTALAKTPRIVLILADDLSFSDTTPYGSEIQTPDISRLADEGWMFTNHHTAVSCSLTRVMLLTGEDSHRNGGPSIPATTPSFQKPFANYTDAWIYMCSPLPSCSRMPDTIPT